MLPPESLLTDLLRLWLLPTGDLHKPLSLCRRHHRVLAQTSVVSLADDVCFFVNAYPSQATLGTSWVLPLPVLALSHSTHHHL